MKLDRSSDSALTLAYISLQDESRGASEGGLEVFISLFPDLLASLNNPRMYDHAQELETGEHAYESSRDSAYCEFYHLYI